MTDNTSDSCSVISLDEWRQAHPDSKGTPAPLKTTQVEKRRVQNTLVNERKANNDKILKSYRIR